jgi:hypothetical protein
MPLIGGLIGILRARSWGMFTTNIGTAVFFISLGLFSWGVGNYIWSYYNYFQNVALPYPSWADAGFFPAYLFWIIGIVFLSHSTGAKFSLQEKRNRLLLLSIPMTILCLTWSFIFFVVRQQFHFGEPIKLFFDLAYPSMDIIILTLAILIFGMSVNFFQRKYKLSLFAILAGFICLYFADFTFSYVTSLNIYYNGDIADVLFTSAFYLISWGALSFYITQRKTNSEKKL